MSDPAPLGADAAAKAGGVGRHNPGNLLGNRFRIKEFRKRDGDVELYRASDAQSGADVALRVVPFSPPALAILERDLSRAQRLPPHRNVAAVVGVVRDGAMLLVAYEWQDGHTLRDLLDHHARKGEAVEPARAHTLLGHVAAGLAHAHFQLIHGGINPESVWLTSSGRIRISDLGLSSALPAFARRGGPRGAPAGIYFPPELAQGAQPTPAADVYSLGAILFELLTGQPPVPPLQPPSRLRPGVPPVLDGVVGRALMPTPITRFPTPEAMMQAMATVLGGAAPDPVPAAAAVPADTSPNVAARSFDVAAAAGLSQGEARWLLQKDRLDYGPFSLEQVKQQISDGHFRGDNLIVEMDTGDRQKIMDHPQLGDFARQAERRLEHVRRQRAEQATQTVERTKHRATLVIISAAVVVLGGGLTFFLMNRQAAKDTELAVRAGEADIDEFLKGVKVDFPRTQRPAVRRASKGGGAKGDDPFSSATNLGDVSQGGADEILSDRTIQTVMMGNYRKLVPCLMDEKRRSPGLKDLDLEFIVGGNGKVSAVKVNGQLQGPFPGCVLNRMQSFNFPKYNGSRTIASWSMSLR